VPQPALTRSIQFTGGQGPHAARKVAWILSTTSAPGGARAPGTGVDIVADLDRCAGTPLPFQADTFDEFLASHLFEHLRNPLPFMQELHRIAKPGAKAGFRVPYGSSDDAMEDPTHVRACFLQTFGYFSQPYYWRADYGYRGDWRMQRIQLLVSKRRYQGKAPSRIMEEVMRLRNVVNEMIVEVIAVKPIRAPNRELQSPPPIELVLVEP
jgi:SAM-dependent methyltransferase